MWYKFIAFSETSSGKIVHYDKRRNFSLGFQTKFQVGFNETALIPLKWNRSDTAHVKPDWNRSMKRLQHGYDTTQWNQFQVSGSDTALSRINETAQMKPSGYQLETAQSRLWLLG